MAVLLSQRRHLFSIKPSSIRTIYPSLCPSHRLVSTESESSPKPYSSIPLRKKYQVYFDFFKFRSNPQDAMFKNYQRFGPIFRDKPPTLPEMVISCDPNDLEVSTRAEGKWPKRLGIPPWRDIRDKLKIPRGVLLSLEYEEWYRQRKPISQFMMVPRKVGEYHMDFNNITDDLIHAIKHLRTTDTNILNDVPSLFFKWSFESVSYFVLGKRLGALNIDNVPQDCQHFINSIQDLFSSTQKILFEPPIYRTKTQEKLEKSSWDVYYTALEFVKEKIDEIKEKDKQLNISGDMEVPQQVDFLTYMLHKDELSLEEVTTAAIDLMGGGVDTTSYTLAWTLYCLATNPDVQTKLRNEVMSVMGKEDTVTPEHIHNLPYLRHCIKEAQRLYPIVANNVKILPVDVILSGYHVPKETVIISPTYAMGRLPHLFPEPEVYRPERWDKEATTSPPHQFASLPFGFGPRMCVGRRVAELELNIALARIIKTFTVEYPDNTPMGITMQLFLVPSRQLNLSFSNV